MNTTRNENKRRNILELFLLLLILFLIGYLSSFFFFRLDLTTEKRYTLSSDTKKILKQMDDVAYFKIYLDGDLPVGFIRLRNSLKEMLDEFRAYAGVNIEYEFIDPSEETDNKIRNEFFKQLYESGLNPVNLQVKEKNGTNSEKIIWPGLSVSYLGRETVVNLLVNYQGYSPEANLNASEQQLEFNCINAVHSLMSNYKKRIAFIEGHREYSKYDVADFMQSLSEFYEVSRVKINEYIWSLRDSSAFNLYDLIVIAGPDSTFSDRDKFIIDQYIMNGGRALFAVDLVKVNMDSLAFSNSTLGFIQDINLHDMLFKYGVRVNPSLVQDLQCALIPVNTAIKGQEPNFAPSPWLYFPLLTPSQQSPVTKNLNLIRSEFANTIDTVGENSKVKKTFLLFTSAYSKELQAPVRISLDIVGIQPDPAQFNKKGLPVAVMLEGQFESLFKNRIPPELANAPEIGFRESSRKTRMIVIADGDVVRNQVRRSGTKMYPFQLGYDRYTKQNFGNKDFAMNCVNALLDDKGIFQIRSRELKLRLLDKAQIQNHRIKYQLLNIFIPVVLVVVFGFLFYIIRRKRFS